MMIPIIFVDTSFILAIIFGFLIASRKCDQAIVTSEAALDIAFGQRPVGRIVIGLFGQVVPKTVRNFEALANHEVYM